MKKIYLLLNKGLNGNYYAICTDIIPYGKPMFGGDEMFTYHNHIMVKRRVTYEEAQFLLSTIKHNGNGEVCGGKNENIEELKPKK